MINRTGNLLFVRDIPQATKMDFTIVNRNPITGRDLEVSIDFLPNDYIEGGALSTGYIYRDMANYNKALLCKIVKAFVVDIEQDASIINFESELKAKISSRNDTESIAHLEEIIKTLHSKTISKDSFYTDFVSNKKNMEFLVAALDSFAILDIMITMPVELTGVSQGAYLVGIMERGLLGESKNTNTADYSLGRAVDFNSNDKFEAHPTRASNSFTFAYFERMVFNLFMYQCSSSIRDQVASLLLCHFDTSRNRHLRRCVKTDDCGISTKQHTLVLTWNNGVKRYYINPSNISTAKKPRSTKKVLVSYYDGLTPLNLLKGKLGNKKPWTGVRELDAVEMGSDATAFTLSNVLYECITNKEYIYENDYIYKKDIIDGLTPVLYNKDYYLEGIDDENSFMLYGARPLSTVGLCGYECYTGMSRDGALGVAAASLNVKFKPLYDRLKLLKPNLPSLQELAFTALSDAEALKISNGKCDLNIILESYLLVLFGSVFNNSIYGNIYDPGQLENIRLEGVNLSAMDSKHKKISKFLGDSLSLETESKLLDTSEGIKDYASSNCFKLSTLCSNILLDSIKYEEYKDFTNVGKISKNNSSLFTLTISAAYDSRTYLVSANLNEKIRVANRDGIVAALNLLCKDLGINISDVKNLTNYDFLRFYNLKN